MIDRRYLLHGVIPAICAACCFALMASSIKLASMSLASPQLVFLRSIIGLCLIVPFVAVRGLDCIKTSRLRLHLLRSLISVLALNSFFYALGHAGLAETTLLNASSPLFIAILAAVILGEKPGVRGVVILLIGFMGTALIIKPGDELFSLGALLGLASAFFIACTKILIRYMSDTEPVIRTVFYFSLFTSCYTAVPMFWLWQTPAWDAVFMMLLAGVLATVGQLLLTYTFTHNRAVSVAPFSYMIVPLASVIGWIGWQEFPDLYSFLGGLIVIASCVLMSMQPQQSDPWKKTSDRVEAR